MAVLSTLKKKRGRGKTKKRDDAVSDGCDEWISPANDPAEQQQEKDTEEKRDEEEKEEKSIDPKHSSKLW